MPNDRRNQRQQPDLRVDVERDHTQGP
jgi:hypothetical protein